MVSIQLRVQDAGLQIHVIQGLFPIQSSLPLSVFDDPFLAALHGLNHERDIKNSTKPKTWPGRYFLQVAGCRLQVEI